eukprot:275163_1
MIMTLTPPISFSQLSVSVSVAFSSTSYGNKPKKSKRRVVPIIHKVEIMATSMDADADETRQDTMIDGSSSSHDHDGPRSSIIKPHCRWLTTSTGNENENFYISSAIIRDEQARSHRRQRQQQLQRRVRFVDEVAISGVVPSSKSKRSSLITSTKYRPRTRLQDKHKLYYDSQDYAFFALEDYYAQLQFKEDEEETINIGIGLFPGSRKRHCQEIKTFGWEDYMNIDLRFKGDDGENNCHDNIGIIDDQMNTGTDTGGSAMHKVKTLHNLHS